MRHTKVSGCLHGSCILLSKSRNGYGFARNISASSAAPIKQLWVPWANKNKYGGQGTVKCAKDRESCNFKKMIDFVMEISDLYLNLTRNFREFSYVPFSLSTAVHIISILH